MPPKLMTNPTAASSGKFSPAVFKRRRPSKARSLGRRRNGEISLRRLLFAKLFLCACADKEKADYRLSVCIILLNVNVVINLSEFCTAKFVRETGNFTVKYK